MSLRDAIATRLAKLDNGEHYVGFESSQREKADAILAVFRSYYSGHPERVSDEIVTAYDKALEPYTNGSGFNKKAAHAAALASPPIYRALRAKEKEHG